jgi:penicillin-binding protein 2
MGEALGWINFTGGIVQVTIKCFYEMGIRLGIDKSGEYARMFGLGAIPGINGRRCPTVWSPTAGTRDGVRRGLVLVGVRSDAAIGRVFTSMATPLQMAVVMAQIATAAIATAPTW